jgi:hypothetical protein
MQHYYWIWLILVPTGSKLRFFRLFCRHSKCRRELSHYLKRFMMESRFLPSSVFAAKIYITVVSIQCIIWEPRRSPMLMPCFANNYLPVLYSNIRNRAVLGLSQVWSCTDICKNLSDKIKVKPIKRFLFCLGCSNLPRTKYMFPHRTIFQCLCPQRSSKLGRQPCWVAYILVCVPGPVGDDGSFLSCLLVFLLSPSQGRDTVFIT